MNNVVQELKTLMKDNMDHNNTIFEDFDKNFLEIKKTDTFEMIFGFEDTLYKLYDKYESSIQKMHNIQMMINNVRDVLLENISPVMSTDKLLEKYKLFFVQYALKMQNGKQNFEHDIPNKVDILCKKLHVLMEKTDDAPDKDSVYKLDNSAKKHLINLENSDNEDSDSDSDKQKTLDTKPAKGKKVVKMVQRDSDSE